MNATSSSFGKHLTFRQRKSDSTYAFLIPHVIVDSIGLFYKQLGKLLIQKAAHIHQVMPERTTKTETQLQQQLQINFKLCCCRDFSYQMHLCLVDIAYSGNFEVSSPRQVLGNLLFVKDEDVLLKAINNSFATVGIFLKTHKKDWKPTGQKTMMDQTLHAPYPWTMHPKHQSGTHSSWPQDNLEKQIFFLFLFPLFTTFKFQ